MATPVSGGTPMDVAEFQRILNIGLGRAILYLQQHSASPYRDAILYALLNVTALDPQSEGDRADYLWDVLQLSGEADSFRPLILQALATTPVTDTYRQEQLFELALKFAQTGDQAAGEAIRRKFEENLAAEQTDGVWAVAALDGLDSLGAMLIRLSEQPFLQDDGLFIFDWLVTDAEDRFGEAEVRAALEAARANNAQLRAVLDGVAARQRIKPEPVLPSEASLRARIESGRGLPRGWKAWFADAPSEVVERFAADLLAEDNPTRLRLLLHLFQARPFPLALDKLFWIAERGVEDRMSGIAIHDLAQVTHPDVRALAQRLIAQGERVGWGVTLLQHNYVEGDWALITELTGHPQDAESYHSLGFGVADVYAQHPSDEAAQAFLNLYEYGACSACRERHVEKLHHMDRLPSWMLEECRYDSNPHLRAATRRGFVDA